MKAMSEIQQQILREFIMRAIILNEEKNMFARQVQEQREMNRRWRKITWVAVICNVYWACYYLVSLYLKYSV
jgi:hypothetical protein